MGNVIGRVLELDNDGERCLKTERFGVSQTWGLTCEVGRGKDTLELGGWVVRRRRKGVAHESGVR